MAFRRDVLPPSSCEHRIGLKVGNRTSSGQSYKSARHWTTTVCRRIYESYQEISGSVLRLRRVLVGSVLESRLMVFVFSKTSVLAMGPAHPPVELAPGFFPEVGGDRESAGM